MASESSVKELGARFRIDGSFVRAERFGSGHINDTWRSEYEAGGTVVRYVHQAINEEIFRDVAGVMRNVDRVTTHLRVRAAASEDANRWEVPALVPTREDELWCRDERGVAWRTYECIEPGRTFDEAPGPDVAREAARGFGRFARELADFDPSTLVESIPRFHDLDGRIARLRGATFEDPVGRAALVDRELEAIWSRVDIADEMRALRASGGLPVRVAHNDTKVNNALIDETTGRAVAILDLDTVMPGTLLFDYGDLVRTASCRAAEDEPDARLVTVEADLFEAVTEGFVSEISSFATEAELDHLLFGGRFMTYIIGIRFLTDYIEGDPYFRTARPDHNLDRARTQLALLGSLEENAVALEECIRRARR